MITPAMMSGQPAAVSQHRPESLGNRRSRFCLSGGSFICRAERDHPRSAEVGARHCGRHNSTGKSPNGTREGHPMTADISPFDDKRLWLAKNDWVVVDQPEP